MTEPKEDLSLEIELLDSALDAFFVARYGAHLTLNKIGAKSLISDERYVANALRDLRVAQRIPSPSVIGARRCVGCSRVMTDDELSMDSEEDVCERCAN